MVVAYNSYLKSPPTTKKLSENDCVRKTACKKQKRVFAGGGSYGLVWKAEVFDMDTTEYIETVAIKLNQEEEAHDSELSTMKLLKGVPHSVQLKMKYLNVVFVGHPSLIMEYIDGCDAFALFYERGCDHKLFQMMMETTGNGGGNAVLRKVLKMMVEFPCF